MILKAIPPKPVWTKVHLFVREKLQVKETWEDTKHFSKQKKQLQAMADIEGANRRTR